ncbi:MAG TPA: hypothetical protein VHB97_15270, partial [Polyangia bacterium]|nr:hypothetical protein [Polyangia bacterium]
AYPWSSPPASMLIDRSHSAWGAAAAQPVGATPLGDGRWGQADLAGNVFELMHDFTDLETYIDPCINCVSTAGTFGAAIRAGSFDAQAAFYERTAYHDAVAYNDRNVAVGARCARAK